MQRCVSGRLVAGICVLSCVLSCVLNVGCSEPSNMGKVSGTVSVDGQPVENGSISFISVDGMSPTAGGTIVDGKYTSEAPLSEARVEIRVPKIVGKKKLYDTPDSPVQDIMTELLPRKYNEETELRFTAERGNNEKNWELSLN